MVLKINLLLAVPSEADSLRMELNKEIDTDARVELLYALGKASVNDDVRVVRTCSAELEYISRNSDHPRAHLFALDLASLFYKKASDPINAVYFARAALKAAESLEDPERVAWQERQLAVAYLDAKDPEEGKKYFERSIQHHAALGKSYDHTTLSDLARLANSLGDHAKAERLYLQSIDSAKVHAPNYNKFNYANLGLVYKNTGRCDQAIPVLEAALEIIEEEENRGGYVFVNAILGGCQNDLGNHRAALFHHQQSLFYARQQQAYHSIKLATNDVWRDFQLLGEADSALYYADLYISLSDSLYQTTLDARLTELQGQFDEERERENDAMEQEIARLEETHRKNRILLVLSVAIAILVLLIIWAALRIRRRKQLNEALEGIVASRTDALRETNAQLRREIGERQRSESELSTLVYRASHDLQGPLKSIQGLLDISQAQVQSGSPSELPGYLNLMGQKVGQLDEVLSHLVEHISVTEREMKREPVQLDDLWQEAVEGLELAGKMEIELEDESKGTFFTDREALLFILRNLLHNAYVFRSPDRAAHCWGRFRRSADGLWVEVSDNGIGMDGEVRERAEEMFFRGHLNSQGSGLGLFIVGKIVRKMGGHLDIASTPGSGSTISIFLPVPH